LFFFVVVGFFGVDELPSEEEEDEDENEEELFRFVPFGIFELLVVECRRSHS